MLIVKRNGEKQQFNAKKIKNAITKAFFATRGHTEEDSKINSIVEEITSYISDGFGIEEIQEKVIFVLSKNYVDVASKYTAYKNKRQIEREIGSSKNEDHLQYVDLTPFEEIKKEMEELLFEGVTEDQAKDLTIMCLKNKFIEHEKYNRMAAHILISKIKKISFSEFISLGVKENVIDKRLLDFNLEAIKAAIDFNKNYKFQFLGTQILMDRYLLKLNGDIVENPQYFFMRVAMGLSFNEKNKENKAIEFYRVMSDFDYIPSTPTLFNSGLIVPQLSSCYVATVEDDMEGIFGAIKNSAHLSKWAGGLANDLTYIRGTGAEIKGTRGESQGVIPFAKIFNDTAIAVNQGGKRKGAMCLYLETWHIDIETFLEAKKNVGDDRRRLHDVNTANWIPDLFMQRVEEDKDWTLFSPEEAKGLHDTYGEAFEKLYEWFEMKAEKGEIKIFKKIKAKKLWQKMITMLFETGHPWMLWKDRFNEKNPQKHVGVIHSSNLCFSGDTLVCLHSGKTIKIKQLITRREKFEVMCAFRHNDVWVTDNQSAIAFFSGRRQVFRFIFSSGGYVDCTPEHPFALKNGEYKPILECFRDKDDIQHRCGEHHCTVSVIDYTVLGEMDVYDLTVESNNNFYIKATNEEEILVHNCTEIALNTSFDEIAVCNLGSVNLMNHIKDKKFDFQKMAATISTAIRMLDNVIDINFYPVKEARNSNLKHRPIGLGIMGVSDALATMEIERESDIAEKVLGEMMEFVQNIAIHTDVSLARDRGSYETFPGSKWDGMVPFMRNSNLTSIAPTATIADIIGVSHSVDPVYENIFVRSNLSGDFIVVNEVMRQRLMQEGLWTKEIISKIIKANGSLQQIEEIPDRIKKLFETAFEIDQLKLIDQAAAMQKNVDQSISLNLYSNLSSGKLLSDMYFYAWKKGLKSTYYLRTKGVSKAGEICSIVNKDECEACQ